MIDIQHASINTAGAYVCVDGLYVFALGIRSHHGRIPVVRLGGHREGQETGWQCAAREVYEESTLRIAPLRPSATYVCDWDHMDAELQEIQWKHSPEQEPAPSLVVTYRRNDTMHLSVMYTAHAEGVPAPSCEVKGLILLETEHIHRLCREPLTLGQYLDDGGKAILRAVFDTKLVLEPFAQLRLLSRILTVQAKQFV